MRLVLANGVFDVLHPGHVAHLQEARRMGDRLMVALTLDAHVKKKGRPIQTWYERAAVLWELRCVDDVVQCRDAVEAIYTWNPDVFVKGSDYEKKGLRKAEIKACKEVGAQIRFTKAPKESTTNLIERIKFHENSKT